MAESAEHDTSEFVSAPQDAERFFGPSPERVQVEFGALSHPGSEVIPGIISSRRDGSTRPSSDSMSPVPVWKTPHPVIASRLNTMASVMSPHISSKATPEALSSAVRAL